MSLRARLIRALPFLKRAFLNVFIVGLLLVFAADACPPVLPNIWEVKDRVSVPLHRLGIWQGSWTLFAPEVRKINLRVRAIVTFADGQAVTVSSPNWPEMSRWQRFWHYRDGKFTDAIRSDTRQPYWESYARWFAHNTPHPEGKKVPAVRVALVRLWNDIPYPSVETRALPLDTWANFDNSYSYTFYEGGPFP